MSPSKRLKEILKKNAEFEKESPYNFCDRWCERCLHEKQMRCKLYHDEFEQKVTCIAHGRDPDDPEITAEVLRRQLEDVEDVLEKYAEENEIDLDEMDDPEFEKIKEHIKFVENNPLQKTAEQYLKKAHEFLEDTFYKNESVEKNLSFYFKTVSWYHTLLAVKLNRALAGFHEPSCEGDLSLYDAVAQLQVCKKAGKESVKALQKIKKTYLAHNNQIVELNALLGNIQSRIAMLEESV